jgi:hypothetical protein
VDRNTIITTDFSNPVTDEMYRNSWPGEPELKERAQERGEQCGACSFFAPFNADYGLCCHPESRHHLETVFEHFTCPVYEQEGWGPHSFTTMKEHHCRCNGEGSEYWDNLLAVITKHEQGEQAAGTGKDD